MQNFENFSGDTLYFMHFHAIDECSLGEFYKMQKSGRACIMLIRNDNGIVVDNVGLGGGSLMRENSGSVGKNFALNMFVIMRKLCSI